MQLTKYFYLLAFCSFLTSCAGYHLGGSKPAHLVETNSIYVPLFKNDTLLVRAESIATNYAVDALISDGTYAIASADNADAVLEGKITKVTYTQARASRLDTLRSDELNMQVTIAWKLRDANNRLNVLESGVSQGKTRFFARGNLNTARMNALPDAIQRATEAMVTRLADGF
jgi:outer membrane lipopolysaccharide assembly protein LptE/RlpB